MAGVLYSLDLSSFQGNSSLFLKFEIKNNEHVLFQVVAALSQFSSLLSSARTGSSSGTYRRINTQRTNRKTKQIASQAAKQTDEVKKATKVSLVLHFNSDHTWDF